MYKRLFEFLDKVDAFYSLQFGFREKHSTNHALISMTQTIQSTLDNGKYGCGVFIDMGKGFDTVNHSMLLKKMDHHGVRGIALDWLSSDLSETKQYVSGRKLKWYFIIKFNLLLSFILCWREIRPDASKTTENEFVASFLSNDYPENRSELFLLIIN